MFLPLLAFLGKRHILNKTSSCCCYICSPSTLVSTRLQPDQSQSGGGSLQPRPVVDTDPGNLGEVQPTSAPHVRCHSRGRVHKLHDPAISNAEHEQHQTNDHQTNDCKLPQRLRLQIMPVITSSTPTMSAESYTFNSLKIYVSLYKLINSPINIHFSFLI